MNRYTFWVVTSFAILVFFCTYADNFFIKEPREKPCQTTSKLHDELYGLAGDILKELVEVDRASLALREFLQEEIECGMKGYGGYFTTKNNRLLKQHVAALEQIVTALAEQREMLNTTRERIKNKNYKVKGTANGSRVQ